MTLLSHSVLTARLLGLPDVPPRELEHWIANTIRLTGQGVNREGGTEDAVIMDHAPVSNQATDAEAKAPIKSGNGFVFGRTSEKELVGVKPEMVAIAREALVLTTQDFMIFDGLRTREEQEANVRKGVSKTMNSKHLPQADGFSWAFDAVPVNAKGQPVWDWNLIWAVAEAVDAAATNLGFASHVRWGGAWDRTLADFGGDASAYKLECELYAQRHPGKDFLDGPHFEWVA